MKFLIWLFVFISLNTSDIPFHPADPLLRLEQLSIPNTSSKASAHYSVEITQQQFTRKIIALCAEQKLVFQRNDISCGRSQALVTQLHEPDYLTHIIEPARLKNAPCDFLRNIIGIGCCFRAKPFKSLNVSPDGKYSIETEGNNFCCTNINTYVLRNSNTTVLLSQLSDCKKIFVTNSNLYVLKHNKIHKFHINGMLDQSDAAYLETRGDIRMFSVSLYHFYKNLEQEDKVQDWLVTENENMMVLSFGHTVELIDVSSSPFNVYKFRFDNIVINHVACQSNNIICAADDSIFLINYKERLVLLPGNELKYGETEYIKFIKKFDAQISSLAINDQAKIWVAGLKNGTIIVHKFDDNSFEASKLCATKICDNAIDKISVSSDGKTVLASSESNLVAKLQLQ